MEALLTSSVVLRGKPLCGGSLRASAPAPRAVAGPVTARMAGGRGSFSSSGGGGFGGRGGFRSGGRTELPRAPPVPTKPWKPLPSVSAPEGTAWYETMLLLRPDASNAERAAELDKINAFLTKAGAGHVETTARDPAKTSYAIKGHTTVYYVQLMYTAEPKVVQALHAMFAEPIVGAVPVLLRYMTFKKP